MNHLDTWNRISRPPVTALKKITGGRLNGKSDINPQWRLKAMTETFGPVGTGWKYTIDKLWTEEGDAGERMAFALVSVHVNDAGIWSQPVPGIGGSMMIAKEKTGLYNSDEAYKMAVTDALSVAFKAFGMAADIYLGNWDGSKYRDDQPARPEVPPSKDQCSQIADNLKLTSDERKIMFEAAGQNYSNLLIMLKAKQAERDDALGRVFDSSAGLPA